MKYRSRRSLNVAMILGLFFVLGILSLSIAHSDATAWIYVNLIGIAIVFGGIISSTLIMYPLFEIKDLGKQIWACLYGKMPDNSFSVAQIVHMAELQRADPRLFTQRANEVANPMLREGLNLLTLGFKQEELKRYLDMRMETTESKFLSQSGLLMTLSKLGPAFGLVGTLFGLVALLHEMGASADLSRVGPAMAIALCATLYGVTLANLLFYPLAEYLIYKMDQIHRHDQLIAEGILMIHDGQHPINIREKLKSFMSRNEHNNLDQILAQSAQKSRSVTQGDAHVA